MAKLGPKDEGDAAKVSVLEASSPTPSPTPSLTWVDEHALGIQAGAAVATVLLTLALVLVTGLYAYWTWRLATEAKESAGAARDLIDDQQSARRNEHAAAVEAVYQELTAIAEPLGLILIHGGLNVRVPFAVVSAYQQVLGALYRGLPSELGSRLAKTYSLLDIQRRALEKLTINVHQLKLVYNEDLIPTIQSLHQHLHDLARDLPEPPQSIPDDHIHLTQQMVDSARSNLSAGRA